MATNPNEFINLISIQAKYTAAGQVITSLYLYSSLLLIMNTIHNSIERRNYLQFDILVTQRTGLNKADAKGLTPLMKVCHEPKKRNAIEMIRLLLKQQANTSRIDKKGRNALMHAALVSNKEAVEMILDAAYFDPAFRDHQGNAPIHYAAMSGDLAVLEVILDHMKKFRVKADLRNDQGLTPLHMAASQGHVAAARYLHSKGDCSLTNRDGTSNRTARDWLEEVCDIPQYMDPFALNADVSQITPKKEPKVEEIVDNSHIRLFLYMKEKPEIDQAEIHGMKPPWDISTNINTPVKYLKNGTLNPARYRRPASAQSCHHYSGASHIRPFSAPCGFQEFSSWKHPLDVQPYLSINDLNSLKRIESLNDIKEMNANNEFAQKQAISLLSKRRG